MCMEELELSEEQGSGVSKVSVPIIGSLYGIYKVGKRIYG